MHTTLLAARQAAATLANTSGEPHTILFIQDRYIVRAHYEGDELHTCHVWTVYPVRGQVVG